MEEPAIMVFSLDDKVRYFLSMKGLSVLIKKLRYSFPCGKNILDCVESFQVNS